MIFNYIQEKYNIQAYSSEYQGYSRGKKNSALITYLKNITFWESKALANSFGVFQR